MRLGRVLRVGALALVLLCGLMGSRAGWADGCYIPDRSYPRPPELPSQRALIVMEDARETLIVESTMKAEGEGSFVWLLPLPAQPTELKPVSPGGLSTLEFAYAPRLLNWSEMGWGLTLWLSLFALAVTSGVISPGSWRRTLDYLIILGIIAGLSFISVGSFDAPLSRPGPSVTALRNERVGNYHVAVLQASRAADIEQWLGGNGFAPLPSSARAAVDDYLAQGWVILAAQLESSGQGLLSPHPLQVTFPASQPVYPMRLTALGGSPVDLSLFVLGPQAYAHPQMDCICAHHYAKAEIFEEYSSSHPSLRNNKDLRGLLDERGWLTHLHATLKPAQMDQDFVLAPAARQAEYHQVLYTPGAVLWKALFWIALLWLVVVSVMALTSRWKVWPLGPIFFILVGLSFIITLAFFALLPVTRNARTIANESTVRSRYRNDLRNLVVRMKEEHKEDPGLLAQAVRREMLANGRSFFTDLPIREEQSPGNFELIGSPATGLSLCVYDERCSPWTNELIPPPGARR